MGTPIVLFKIQRSVKYEFSIKVFIEFFNNILPLKIKFPLNDLILYYKIINGIISIELSEQ